MSLINDALKRASQSQKDNSQTASGPAMQPVQPPQKSKTPLIAGLAVALAVVMGVSGWLFLQWSREREQRQAGLQPKQSTMAPSTNRTPAAPHPAGSATNRATAAATNPVASQTQPVSKQPLANVPAKAAVTQAVAAVTQAPAATTNTTVVSAPAHTATATAMPANPPAPSISNNAPAGASPAHASSVPASAAPASTTAAPASQKTAPLNADGIAPLYQSRTFPTLRLKAILYSGTSPQVIINGSTLGLGEEIDGAKIVKIERRRVTVKWNGVERQIGLD